MRRRRSLVTPATTRRRAKVAKRAAAAAFAAVTGRRLSGRQWARIRKRQECYAGFTLWYHQQTGRALTPRQYAGMNRLAAVMGARAEDPPAGNPVGPTLRWD